MKHWSEIESALFFVEKQGVLSFIVQRGNLSE